MTSDERLSLVGAGVLHLALLAGLSLALANSKTMLPAPTDAIPVELVTIADAPRVVEAPKPSLQAAPQEPAAAPAPTPEAAPAPEPLKAATVPPPEPVKPKPAERPKSTASKAPPSPLDTSTLASLIDKSLPKAKTRPLNTSKLATEINSAAPAKAAIDPRAAATLAQAIRAQVAACWNPPMGGRDVQRMTVLVHVTYGRDGRVIGQPSVGTPTGTTAGNADYARAFAETARRAVLRCQPLKLPPELYDLWASVEINFDPDQMT